MQRGDESPVEVGNTQHIPSILLKCQLARKKGVKCGIFLTRNNILAANYVLKRSKKKDTLNYCYIGWQQSWSLGTFTTGLACVLFSAWMGCSIGYVKLELEQPTNRAGPGALQILGPMDPQLLALWVHLFLFVILQYLNHLAAANMLESLKICHARHRRSQAMDKQIKVALGMPGKKSMPAWMLDVLGPPGGFTMIAIE